LKRSNFEKIEEAKTSTKPIKSWFDLLDAPNEFPENHNLT
jgi:hypothetical protein